MILKPGTTVDRYEVEAWLGEGGMAVVYRVRHRALGSVHALKVLTGFGARARERLVREGRVQAALASPHIVTVTDLVDVDGSPGLVMQYVDGPTLEAALERERMSLATVEALFAGILAAVECAHAAGVVHRDLKPGNVFLARTASGPMARVADFGLARALRDERGPDDLTRTGMAMGTPSYMAPEQIRDARGADARADIFALGCLLYEMTTGKLAFPGEHPLEIFNAVVSGAYVPPLHVAPGLPARVDRTIRGALEVDVGRRIPDCATLREVLSGARGWGDTPAETVSAARAALALAEEYAREGERGWVSAGDVHRALVSLGRAEPAALPNEPRLRAAAAVRPVPTPAATALLRGHAEILEALCPRSFGSRDGSTTLDTTDKAPTGVLVLTGPEQGRWLAPVPGDHVGRHRSSDGPEQALYVDRAQGVDLVVHGRHLRWLGEGRIAALHGLRVVGVDDTRAVAAGEIVSVADGDEVWLSPATGLRLLATCPAWAAAP